MENRQTEIFFFHFWKVGTIPEISRVLALKLDKNSLLYVKLKLGIFLKKVPRSGILCSRFDASFKTLLIFIFRPFLCHNDKSGDYFHIYQFKKKVKIPFTFWANRKHNCVNITLFFSIQNLFLRFSDFRFLEENFEKKFARFKFNEVRLLHG